MIRAKFRCNSVRNFKDSEVVELNAVCDDRNKQWARWTPSGQVSIQIDNPDARGRFEPGKCYFLDFSEAPEDDQQTSS